MSAGGAAWRETYGPWAVVTGASDGIGLAFARDLARRGLDLVLVARRENVLLSVAEALSRDHGISTRVVAVDLGTADGHEKVDQAARDLDVGLLVAAAGFGTSGPFIDADLGNETDMVAVNCLSLAALTHVFGGRLARRGRGGIVLMSSILAFQGVRNAANYAATKAYVQTLAEGLRPELAANGVHVIASAPGPTRSGFAARADLEMGVAQNPPEVASATLDALGRRGTVRPGWLSKLLAASFVGQPRFVRSLILGKVMTGMTRAKGAQGR